MIRLSESIFIPWIFISLILLAICLAGCERGQKKESPKEKEKVQLHQPSSSLAEKRVLYINSYHPGYEWSDAIDSAIFKYFKIPIEDITTQGEGVGDVRLRIMYMDSKRHRSEQYLQRKGLEIKEFIEDWHPDVVITSDDNAAKYIIAPYFRNHTIPFVFCGINWDASEYGLPVSNVTGMLEVQLIDDILAYLKPFAKGPRVGFLKGDDMSARKEAAFYEKRFALSLDARFVKNFAEWQKQYLALQQEADMLLLGNAASIIDWNPDEAKKIVAEHTRIPSGNWDLWMAPYALMTFATDPKEQGEWAAKTAKEILLGKDPSSIAIVHNVVAHIVLNMQLADSLNVKFPIDLIERAEFVGSRQ